MFWVGSKLTAYLHFYRSQKKVYEENRHRYGGELNDVKRKIDRLDTADKEFYITASYLLRLFENAGKIYEVADEDEKRQIIGLISSNLELDNKNLDFNLKEPFATCQAPNILNTPLT